MAEGRTLFRVFPHNILYPGIFLLHRAGDHIMGDGLRDTLESEDEQESLMPDKKPVLEVRNLSVALPTGADRAHAVEKVSFTVNPGEIVCLVGESGSGKSVIAFTVMGLLAKALKPTSARSCSRARTCWRRARRACAKLRCTRMSMIFQEPMTALNPVMTCGEQIDEVLRTHTRLDASERKAKIIAILTRVKLPEPERIYASYPHQLSGGQRQRIMIAMALVLVSGAADRRRADHRARRHDGRPRS